MAEIKNKQKNPPKPQLQGRQPACKVLEQAVSLAMLETTFKISLIMESALKPLMMSNT